MLCSVANAPALLCAMASVAGRAHLKHARLGRNVIRMVTSSSSDPPSPPLATLLEWTDNTPEFESGMASFKSGEYSDAVEEFTRAVVLAPGGFTGRLGGQYAVWVAQALSAAGNDKEASLLLERCLEHSDADVQGGARQILDVIQAPELKPLTADDSISIPSFQEGEMVDYTALLSARNRDTMLRADDAGPETYSVEWFDAQAKLAKKQPAIEEDGGYAGDLLVLSAALLGSVGLGFLTQGLEPGDLAFLPSI
jgi:hypothetical protein